MNSICLLVALVEEGIHNLSRSDFKVALETLTIRTVDQQENSNGMDIYFNVAFKPVATLIQEQTTINSKGETVEMMGKGRHDPCVVPRAVPIVEALAAMVMADSILIDRSRK